MAYDVKPVAVFVGTNLDTYMAIQVSPNLTVGEFKKQVETQHLSLFEGIGEIEVDAVMVEWKSCFYHLSDSVPLKYVSWIKNQPWSLRAQVQRIKDSSRRNDSMIPMDGVPGDANTIADAGEDKGKDKAENEQSQFLQTPQEGVQNIVKPLLPKSKDMKRVDKVHVQCLQSKVSDTGKLGDHVAPEKSVQEEEPLEKSSEVISVTAIINKYFKSSDMESVDSPDFTSRIVRNEIPKDPKTQKCRVSRMKNLETYPSNKQKTSRVGNRLVEASHGLRINACRSPAAALRRVIDGKQLHMKHNQANNQKGIFDMSDSDN